MRCFVVPRSDTNDDDRVNKTKKVIRRKQFDKNNLTGLFDGLDPPSGSTTNQSSASDRTTGAPVTMSKESTHRIEPANTDRSPKVNESSARAPLTHVDTKIDSEENESDGDDTESSIQLQRTTTTTTTTTSAMENDEVELLLNDEDNADLDRLRMKYQKLQARCERLQKEFSALKNKNIELKTNSIRKLFDNVRQQNDLSLLSAKPPAGAHEWLVQLGRLCDSKPTPSVCQPMAKELSMDVMQLINLIGNSKTQTTRNIINCKLTFDQKLTCSYKDFPSNWRKGIHGKFVLN